MRKISKEKLDEILEKHKKWVNSENGGKRANLQGANLQEADLQYVKLEGAYGEQDTERRIKKMTNYEYIKTLSQDELVLFIMNDMTMAANDILDEIIRCWSDDERSSTEIRMWKNWLNEQRRVE
jgi:hypothetical protein